MSNQNKDPKHWRKVQAQRKRYIKECVYCGIAYEGLAISHFCCDAHRHKYAHEKRARLRKAKFYNLQSDSDQ